MAGQHEAEQVPEVRFVADERHALAARQRFGLEQARRERRRCVGNEGLLDPQVAEEPDCFREDDGGLASAAKRTREHDVGRAHHLAPCGGCAADSPLPLFGERALFVTHARARILGDAVAKEVDQHGEVLARGMPAFQHGEGRVGMVLSVAAPRTRDRTSIERTRLARPREAPRLGVALGIVAIAACAGFVWFVLDWFDSGRTTITFAAGGAGAPDVDMTFFPDRLAFASPSPPRSIGRLAAHGAKATVGTELVPGNAVVCYRAPGFGTGFRAVRLGESVQVELRAPGTLRGQVVEPIASWCFGWRCAAQLPIAGAEVLVMGGGEHGIVLGNARTDGDGRFVIDGIDVALDGLGFRVLAPGFAIAHRPVERDAGDTAVPLARSRVSEGRVRLPAGIDPTTLHVLARGLPGVQAQLASDGSFRLDHVPVDTQPRLLVHGLPPTMAHALARATGDPVVIDVVLGAAVRGRVVDAGTRTPITEALVYCGEDHAVRTDSRGEFELTGLLPGATEIRAQQDVRVPRHRPQVRSGREHVALEPGKVIENIVVAVE